MPPFPRRYNYYQWQFVVCPFLFDRIYHWSEWLFCEPAGSLRQRVIDHIKSFSLVWNDGALNSHAYWANVRFANSRIHIEQVKQF